VLVFQVPVTARLLYVPPNATFFTPFTWSVGPEMAALVDGLPVPVAIPLWQVEQFIPVWPMCSECLPVLVAGMLWQDVHVTALPVQVGTAAVFPPVKFPWQ